MIIFVMTGRTGKRPCPKPYTEGYQTWYCSNDRQFTDSNPDRSDCRVSNDSPCDYSLPKVCNCTDPTGERWVFSGGKTEIKPCLSPLVGNRTWECIDKGDYSQFSHLNHGPDVSDCVNKWVNDIIDKV